MLRTLLCIILSGIVLSGAYAQKNTGTLTGRITDNMGESLPHATVYLKKLQSGGTTNLDGYYKIKEIPYGTYQVSIQFVGYLTETLTVTINKPKVSLDVTLKEDKKALAEVEIVDKSEELAIKEGGFAVDIVRTEIFQNTTTDVSQVIKGISGVVVRESGGLGSNFNLSLNGLSGNQIRYFLDGIPMENFGSSFSLNNFPVNLIKNIEVYKGVVPIHLGADALGGAINISTTNSQKSYLDAAYSFGSFNTHRASVVGQYSNTEKGYFINLSTFFNHADNNYWMRDVTVYDELGNPSKTIKTRRFHDQYTSGMLNLKAGLINKNWADEFSMSFSLGANRKNYQHPDNNIKRVFGDFHTENETYLANLIYKKSFEKLFIKGYALVGNMEFSVVDTSSRKYNWEGEYTIRDPQDPKAELYERKSLFEFNDKVLRSNVVIGYDFTPQHQLSGSFTHGYLKRSGQDLVNEFNRSFESPNYIHKYFAGLAYRFKNKAEKLETTVFGKYYGYNGKIITQDLDDNDITTKPSFGKLGYGLASSYRLSNHVQLKLSLEKTYRVPEPHEILGDGIYINPNPSLLPEQSQNINFGFSLEKEIEKFTFKSEGNLFYRASSDFIRFAPQGPFGNYENLDKVRSEGIESSFEVIYNKKFSALLNATYQNITDQTEFDEGLPNTNYQSRVPNIPYFIGNLRLGANLSNPQASNQFSIAWQARYVHDFFLIWENLGNADDKNIIPSQFIQDLDFTYSLSEGKYNISLSVKNIANTLAYDNFNIQRPGRAIYMKLRYFIN